MPRRRVIKAYQKYSYLEHHLNFGKHQYSLESESLLDKAMVKQAEKLESGKSSVEGKTASNLTDQTTQVGVVLSPMGWALKGGATGWSRFTDQQKKFLIDLFILGEQTGRKADPDKVAKAMQKARITDGSFLFQSDEYLTSTQI